MSIPLPPGGGRVLVPKTARGAPSRGWWWLWWHKEDVAPLEPLFQAGKGMEHVGACWEELPALHAVPRAGARLCLPWKSFSCRVWVWKRVGINSWHLYQAQPHILMSWGHPWISGGEETALDPHPRWDLQFGVPAMGFPCPFFHPCPP